METQEPNNNPEIQNENHSELKPASGNFFSLLIPHKGFFITPILIILNVLIFVLMILNGVHFMEPTTDDLLRWGANFRPSTLNGEWWRLITCTFIHIGVLHLLLNMYALLYIGILLEPLLGTTKFASAYLITGVFASLTSLAWHDLTVSAGASGAIFGMYGVFLAMLTTNLIEKEARKQLLTSIGVFVGYNLLYGLKGGIDNAAHLGGLISGLIIGYAFYPGLKNPAKSKMDKPIIAGFSLATIIITFLTFNQLPNDFHVYDEHMNEFAKLEEEALYFYTLTESSPQNEILKSLQPDGISKWNDCIELIKSNENLDLPKEYGDRDKILINYCELRKESYSLLYKAIDEDTNAYDEQLAEVNSKIEALISGLSGSDNTAE